jgi:hypothetical protein
LWKERNCFECFVNLNYSKNDYAFELISILKNNPSENLTKWTELSTPFEGEKLTKWLEYGYKIGLIHNVQDQLLNILEEGNIVETKTRLQTIIGNRFGIINKNLKYKQIVFDCIPNTEISTVMNTSAKDSLNFLLHLTSTYFS